MVCIRLPSLQHAPYASQSATAALYMQAPKRGLSVEEKRQKIQQIFHETQDVFQLKACSPLPSPPLPFEVCAGWLLTDFFTADHNTTTGQSLFYRLRPLQDMSWLRHDPIRLDTHNSTDRPP